MNPRYYLPSAADTIFIFVLIEHFLFSNKRSIIEKSDLLVENSRKCIASQLIVSLFFIPSSVVLFVWEPSKLHVEFLAAPAGHLGFESLSQVLCGSAKIFYKHIYQILRARPRDMYAPGLDGSGPVGTFSGDRIKKLRPRGEPPPERTVKVPLISTKKIYQILKISLRTAMVLTSLLHSMTCTSRGLVHYNWWGPELL